MSSEHSRGIIESEKDQSGRIETNLRVFVCKSWLTRIMRDTADISHTLDSYKRRVQIKTETENQKRRLQLSFQKGAIQRTRISTENVNFSFIFTPKITIMTYQTLFIFSIKRIAPSDASSKPKSARHGEALFVWRPRAICDVTYVSNVQKCFKRQAFEVLPQWLMNRSRRRSLATTSQQQQQHCTTSACFISKTTLHTIMLSSAAFRFSRSLAQKRVLAPSFSQQFRSLFIQTEETPNPESLKFLPGRTVLDVEEGGEVGNGFYATKTDKEEIARSPLAKELFRVEGVKSVYLGTDFVTITKFAESHWMHVKTQVFSALMDFYQTGQPAVSKVAVVTDTTILDDDDEIVAMIKELLESRIRPAVQEDGGDIRYVGFEPESGLVTVKLAGSCVGCPSSSVTLKNGVENMLMHYIPEVTGVNALEEEEEESSGNVEVTDTKAKTYEERLAQAGIPFSD